MMWKKQLASTQTMTNGGGHDEDLMKVLERLNQNMEAAKNMADAALGPYQKLRRK